MWQPPPYTLTSINESIRSREWKLLREITYPQDNWRSPLRRLLGMAPKKPRETLELYHLTDDPQESQDLSATHPEVVRRMRKQLDAWVTKAKAFNPRTQRAQPLPKGLLEDAKARGYW